MQFVSKQQGPLIVLHEHVMHTTECKTELSGVQTSNIKYTHDLLALHTTKHLLLQQETEASIQSVN